VNELRAQASKTTTTDYAHAVAAALRPSAQSSDIVSASIRGAAVVARRVLPDRMIDALIADGQTALTRAASQHWPSSELASS